MATLRREATSFGLWLVAPFLLISLSCYLPARAPTIQPSSPAPEAGQETRAVVIRSVEGLVETRISPATAFSAAQAGMTLTAGDEIRTGAGGQSVLEMDDGTVIVLAEKTAFAITTLEGSASNPVTRFSLNLGEVFSIRQDALPVGASYEVETPAGIAGVRGTAMGASHRPETGSTELTCLFGMCAASAGEVQIDLAGNEWIGMTVDVGIVGEIAPLTPAQLERWARAIEDAANAGLGDAVAARCTCEDRDLACDDGTRIPEFPLCPAGLPGAGLPVPTSPPEPPTPAETPQPTDFSGSWHSAAECEEAEDAPYRWEVSLSQDDSGNVTGTIKFHRCPGGGRAIYAVSGLATEDDFVTLEGQMTASRGDLGSTASSTQTFVIGKGGPPEPNLAP